jgi:hypothetical protein
MQQQLDLCEDFDEAVARYDDGYYNEKLQEGLEFQDVVTQALYMRGIVVVGFSSRRFQNRVGENMLGAEIKRDGNFRKTGNLYLETAEKSHPKNPEYVTSGVMRNDNSWLFVIGDEQTIYIFSTKYLRMLIAQKDWREIRKTTSIGRLMPISDAERYAIRRIDLAVAS